MFNNNEPLQQEAFITSALESEEWEEDTLFEHLKFVKIYCNKYPKSVLMLVRFLLAGTPVLGSLDYIKAVEDAGVLEKLAQLKRASNKS
jgi:hypothetical protein